MKWLIVIALVSTGCGSRCKEVQRAREALVRTPDAGRTADVRVTVPLAAANEVIAELLRAQPLTAPIDLPDLGPIELTTRLSAVVDQARLLPGAPDRVRIAVRLAVRDDAGELTALAFTVEVAPELQRGDDGATLAIGLGPENLLAVKPELPADARRALGDALASRLPAKLRDRLPGSLVTAAAGKLAEHLTGGAFRVLRTTLLHRLGEVTRLRLRLPDVPVARWAILSTEQAMVVELVTDLPVRAGLAPAAPGDRFGVALSGSAVAELANWAIDRGLAPRWYNRSVEPREDGEFRPRFDYVAADRGHPFKVYSFQERGGCSYFRVGVRAAIAMRGDQLEVTALDRELERASANPVLEAAAWVKYFLIGSLDRSKRVAAHTRLAIGERTLETRVVEAAIDADDVRFALALAPGAAAKP